jgi:hypothetical protein
MTESRATSIRKNENFDYWYCQFSCQHSFKCYDIFELMTDEQLQRVYNRTLFIVLDNGLEPFLKSADSIYHNIVMRGIPASQIIFMSSIPTMIDYVKQLSAQLGQEPIKVEWYSFFEDALNDIIINRLPVPLATLEKKKYRKKYINFNRRWRLHRPLMITMLKDKNLLGKGYISFGTSDFPQDNWPNRWSEMQRYYFNDQEILNILDRNIDIHSMRPLYLDTDDLVTNRAIQTSTTDEYYLNTYFSLVTETTYHTKPGYDGVPFWSEKIFKCIAMKHPFIVATVPNSLQYLKQLGYKTFEGIIDESYDLEEDDGRRMIKIINETERLCNLGKKELAYFLNEAKIVCDHNYNILKNKTEFIKAMN